MSDQLKIQVLELKAKLFDAVEATQGLQGQIQELSGGIQRIIEILALTGDAEGRVTIEDVVQGVAELKEKLDANLFEPLVVEAGTATEVED